jgi:hypothetical protein
MTKILFLYNNLLDLATLTASSANADFPVANLKNPFRTKPWRTAGATAGTAQLLVDLAPVWENTGSNLLTTWESYAFAPYNTFTPAGCNVTAAIGNDASASYANNDLSNVLTAGKLYVIVANLTLTSGQAPSLSVGPAADAFGYTDIPTTALSAGVNTIYLTVASSVADYRLWLSNSGDTNYSCTFTLYEQTGGEVDCAALIGYNWEAAPGTLNDEFNNLNSWGSPAVTEALTWAVNPTANGNNGIILKKFTSKSYRYNRLSVVYSPGGTPTDWDLGRMFVGAYFESTGHFNYPWGLYPVDDSILSTTIGGQDNADEIPHYRLADFTCTVRSQALWESHQKMGNTVGRHKDLVIAFDYDNEPDEMTVYGKFLNLPRMSAPKALRFDLPYEFKESR